MLDLSWGKLLSEAGETHKNFGIQMPEEGFSALEDFILSWQRKMFEQVQAMRNFSSPAPTPL
ncbi:MAG: hypothetical protein IJ630_10090 [Treponema sp.]|nr:hypothetical protein [Treponema sp.]